MVIKNKIFLFLNRFRKKRILIISDLKFNDKTYYLQYKKLFVNNWKTYQIYHDNGMMFRLVSTSYKDIIAWCKNLNIYNYIGFNKFKQDKIEYLESNDINYQNNHKITFKTF